VEVAPPEPEKEAAPVIDLMEALRASVAATQAEPAKKPARKRAAAGK
jgi:non-homologous end joining protein Ku